MSSVEFEVLIINCQVDFLSLLIFIGLTSNFCFPKNIPFASRREQLLMDVSSLDFKLTRENDELLSSRYKYIFEVLHPLHKYTKMRVPDKRYRTNIASHN